MAERSFEKQDLRSIIPLTEIVAQDQREAEVLFAQARLRPPNRQRSFDERDPWNGDLDQESAPYERGNIRGWATTSKGGPMSRYTMNEDVFTAYEAPHASLLTVIDGGGGSSSGRAASILSALLLERALDQQVLDDPDGHPTPQSLDILLTRINRALVAQGGQWVDEEGSAIRLFGTIAGVCFLQNEEGEAEHMITFARGDARVLVIREGVILQDASSWFQNQAGVLALGKNDPSLYWDAYRDHHSRLWSGLGVSQDAWNGAVQEPWKNTARVINVQKGDIVLLYTDGVGDVVTDFELQTWAKVAHRLGTERGSAWLHQKIQQTVEERSGAGFDEEVRIQPSEHRDAYIVPNPQYRHEDGTPKNLPSADNYTLATYVVTK